MTATFDRLCDVFADAFEDDELTITRSTSAADIDDWDSVMHVTLMLHVEQAFGIRFTSAEVAGLADVGGLIDLIESKA